MTQPTTYERAYSFTDFSSGSPSSQPPGAKLDAEFDAIGLTTDQILANLAKIQRDDGRLATGSVQVDQLGSTALALIAQNTFKVRGPWLTSTVYAVGDIVTDGTLIYMCMVAHTAGTLSTDVTAGKFVAAFDATTVAPTPTPTPTPGGSISTVRGEFTALAGQTTFGLPSAPIDGFVSVYKNGSRLSSSAFLLSGANVVLSSGASAGDKIIAEGFQPTNLGDAAVVTFTQAGGGAQTENVQAALRRIVFAESYGFSTAGTGAANAASLTNAMSALGAAGGVVAIGPGSFTTDTIYIPANVTIRGAGMGATTLNQGTTPGNTYGLLHVDSGSAAAFVDNIVIRDLTVKNTANTFSEFIHLISLSGVRNVRIQRVAFIGFRGDGLILASGTTAGVERHNRNVVVRECRFDGVNNNNRNAISIIDGLHVKVEFCEFLNCSRTGDGTNNTPSTTNPLIGRGMPGPIDCEPDSQTWPIIDDITVSNCRFVNCGGNVGQVSVQLPAAVTYLPRLGIRVIDCSSDGYVGSSADVAINVSRVVNNTDPDMNCVVRGWKGRNSSARPFIFYNGKGFRVADDCVWEDYAAAALVGFPGTSTLRPRDATLNGTFIRCGGSGEAVDVGYVNGVLKIGARFRDCVTPLGFVNGTAEEVDVCGLVIESPAGTTTAAVISSGYTFTQAKTFSRGARFGAYSVSAAFLTADPVKQLALVAGSGSINVGYTPRAINVQRVSAGGTIGVSFTVNLGNPSTVTARKADGTAETADTSTITYEVIP